MTVTRQRRITGPILDLTLPASTDPTAFVVRNVTTGKQLTLRLPASYDGDDLSLDFERQTITDQGGVDRSALLDATDDALWIAEPLIAGMNDVEVQANVTAPGSSGPLSPGTLADDAGVGATAWTNPGNAAASDNSRATVTVASAGSSHYLKATNFGFAIPAGATIKGIVAEIERSDTSASSPSMYDNSVRIVKGGTIQAAAEKAKGDFWPDADAYVSYGSTEDLWAQSWTVADINATTFGLAASVFIIGSGPQAGIDHIRLTVHYTTSPAAAAYGATAVLRWREARF